MKLLFQSLVIILSFILILIWYQTPLNQLTAPLLGVLIASYLVISLRRRGKAFLSMGGDGPLGIFILNTLIFILIFSTGSVSSPIFFLLYFLGFGISFVFEPAATFVFVIGALFIFLPDVFKNDVTTNLLKVGSLVLISPLAYFFGKEYRLNDKKEGELEALKERTKSAADTISRDVEEILKSEKQNLKEKDMDKLNEVLEETEDLRLESRQE
jgi:hypothetical protein